MASASAPPPLLQVQPIGYVHSPFQSRHSAPRQGSVTPESSGQIHLYEQPWLEHALADLDTFSHIWVLFWFHQNSGFRPKVAPPRSSRKRGVFATRSPYRPNPIGLSLVTLEKITGPILHVRGLDLLDGTPVIDLKPYLAYADQAPDATAGWLDAPHDPAEVYQVVYSELALRQLTFLEQHGCTFLKPAAESVLTLGPAPHPYRRIRRDGSAYRLAIKDFRLRFSVAGTEITVLEIQTGYKRPALYRSGTQPKADTPLSVHRAFIEHFG